ncbi:MAG: ROK family protein [Fibrobacterota bacterium]
MQYWGIDLGGTKIEGAVLDSLEDPKPLARLRLPTEQEKGYRHILGQIRAVLDMLKKETGQSPKVIGIGTPGVLDPRTQTLKNSNTLCLNGQPLKKDLIELLGVPIEMANDANCFALAEAVLGAGRGAETVFGVILGTGCGGGVVVNRKAIYGCQGIAGEWGHNILIPDGAPCYCGKRGCVEMVISGTALEAYYESIAGNRLRLKEIVARARAKSDPHAEATLKRLIEQFGRAISNIINILDPHAIVLGGGVSNVDELYTEGAQEAAKYIFNNRFDTPIVRHALGDSAGVFGAAMLTL